MSHAAPPAPTPPAGASGAPAPSATPPHARPGITTPLHPQVLGGLVGAVGATSFVLLNRGGLPGPGPVLALGLWALALAAYAWFALLRPRVLPDPRPPTPRAGAVYGLAVLGMLALVAGGGALLRATGHAELQPALVSLAVGLHFVPFAAAFHAPVFRLLGTTVAAVGATGVALGLLLGATPALAAAVLAGIAMLGIMTLDARDA